MNKKRLIALSMSALLSVTAFAGCSKDNSSGGSSGTGDKLKGEITVITNRTDIVDTVYKDYAKKFNEKYPDVTVNFEALTDYAGEIKIRMNSKEYGDVLLIPDDVPSKELPNFFEPLGSVEELGKKYMFITEKAYDNKAYGIAIVGNAQGIVYNKKVFEKAGIKSLPKTPDEFIAAMKAIKEKCPDVIPYYTNYAAGWPLTQWENQIPSVSGDPEYVNSLANVDDPFAEGKPHYTVYKLMYDIVKNGLIEKDPTTSDWEKSKVDLAEGKIGAMVLGSWSISQMQEKAPDKNDIGYMPFPSNKDGKMYSATGGDYKIAINKNSKNKEAARAWLDFFVDESGYAVSQGGISPVKGTSLPENLSDFKSMNVTLVENNPAPAGKESLVDDIDKEAQVGRWQDNFKKRIVEAALNNKESFEDISRDLNSKWQAARAKVANK